MASVQVSLETRSDGNDLVCWTEGALRERLFVDILRDETRHGDLSYARVQASGVLERSKTVLLGPRAPPNHHTPAFDDRKPGTWRRRDITCSYRFV